VPPPTGYSPMLPHIVPGRTSLAATPSAYALPSHYRPEARASSPSSLEEDMVVPPPVGLPSADSYIILPPPVHNSTPSSVTEDYGLPYSPGPTRVARWARRAPTVSINFEERLRQLRRGRRGGDGVMNHETSRPHTGIPPRPEPEEYESHEDVNNPVTDDVRTDDGPVPDGTSQHSTPAAQLRTPASVADALRVSCCTRRSTQQSLKPWSRRTTSRSWRPSTSSARLCAICADSATGSTGMPETASPSCVECRHASTSSARTWHKHSCIGDRRVSCLSLHLRPDVKAFSHVCQMTRQRKVFPSL
jgi:hypothetical protein